MKTWIHSLLVAAAVSVSAPGVARADQTMRCPTGRLVRLGDRLLALAQICGAPDVAEQRTVLREVRGRVRNRTWDERRGPWALEESFLVEVQIDEWLYDLGPGRLLRRLVFEDGRLTRIDTLGRGMR
jgi:hypothetical protein